MKQSDFKAGQKWRVIRSGAKLFGMKPAGPYAQQGWSMDLDVGTVLTCDGEKWTFGDGVPVIKWLDAEGNWLASDCEFRPAVGGVWSTAPADGYLMPWSDDVQIWTSANGAIDQRATFEDSVRTAWCDECCQDDVRGLLERAAELEGGWIVWDPEGDDQGFLLVGDDPFELVKQAVDHHEGLHCHRENNHEMH